MDSGDYSSPPSISSGGFRSVDPQLPSYDPPTVEVQAPSFSSTEITHSEPQFPTAGQRLVADVSQDQAVSLSGVRDFVSSLPGGYVDRATSYGGQAPDNDALAHENNSIPGFSGYTGSEGAPSQSAMVRDNLSNPGASAATPASDLEEDPQYSIPGRHFHKNLMGPYNY